MIDEDEDLKMIPPCSPECAAYVNRGPEHMPAGLYDRLRWDRRLAERGERDES